MLCPADMAGQDVVQIHRTLFAIINDKGASLTDGDMAPYVCETVTHNGQATPRAELADNTMLAFPAGHKMRFFFDVAEADNEKQMLRGILRLRALDADDKEVQGSGFQEEFTYWFEDGKVRESKSAMGKDDVKQKMAQAGQSA